MSKKRLQVVNGGKGAPSAEELKAMRAATEKRRKEMEAMAAEEERKRQEKHGDGGNRPPPHFVHECLQANQMGDGTLYVHLHRDKFIFNATTLEWYRWAGHYWERDIEAEALASVDDVAVAYLDEAARITEEIRAGVDDEERKALTRMRENMEKRAFSLRGDERRMKALKFARSSKDSLYVNGEEFDTKPWLLACANGVLDLRTGRLRNGRPDDWLTMAAPIEWQGLDEQAERWEQFLLEVYNGSEPLVRYMQRLLGYGITGLTIEHVLPVLWGKGRNGKGTIVDVLQHVLGPLAGPIQAEMLLDQGRTRSSSGPTADIMSLKGMRLAFASETDEGRKISSSRVKWLSGGDMLVGRSPHDRYETRFKPSHLLLLLTNHKPMAPPDDFALWERFALVPHELSFVNREPQGENECRADLNLGEALRAEASGILAWLVRGCLAWQQQGLDPPLEVQAATNEYRRDEDMILDYLDERCEMDPAAETTAADLYADFEEWWSRVISKKVPKQKWLGKHLLGKTKDGVTIDKRKTSGIIVYTGLRLFSA